MKPRRASMGRPLEYAPPLPCPIKSLTLGGNSFGLITLGGRDGVCNAMRSLATGVRRTRGTSPCMGQSASLGSSPGERRSRKHAAYNARGGPSHGLIGQPSPCAAGRALASRRGSSVFDRVFRVLPVAAVRSATMRRHWRICRQLAPAGDPPVWWGTVWKISLPGPVSATCRHAGDDTHAQPHQAGGHAGAPNQGAPIARLLSKTGVFGWVAGRLVWNWGLVGQSEQSQAYAHTSLWDRGG